MCCIDAIRESYSEYSMERCCENRCELKVNDLHNYIILKGELLNNEIKMADCLVFTYLDKLIIGVTELKSNTVSPSEITEKLENSLDVVMDILTSIEYCEEYKCYLIVIAKSWKTSIFQIIKNKRIIKGGRKIPIIPKRCGIRFSSIFNKY